MLSGRNIIVKVFVGFCGFLWVPFRTLDRKQDVGAGTRPKKRTLELCIGLGKSKGLISGLYQRKVSIAEFRLEGL
jgi:hypothetical protein